MSTMRIFLISILIIDINLNHALNITNLSVPRIIDASQKAKLSCTYDMGNRTLNSVKWYKDGQEFFRYSPLTPPTLNWFTVKGVSIAPGSSVCNQFLCNVELEKLNRLSSGSFRCEVSGDAPEFKLIDKAANMTAGVLPKFDPFISGLQNTYSYGETIMVNCSSEWSNPPATLSWFINNKMAPMNVVYQPQINEQHTRNSDFSIYNFPLYASTLTLRIHLSDKRFIGKSEMLELKCVADIMGIAAVRRESKVRATILALTEIGSYRQRLLGDNSATSGSNAGSNARYMSRCDLHTRSLSSINTVLLLIITIQLWPNTFSFYYWFCCWS